MNLTEAGRIIIILGVILIALGFLLPYLAKLDFFGKLPGDVRIRGENFSFYFPVATCIVLSVILTLVLRLFFKR